MRKYSKIQAVIFALLAALFYAINTPFSKVLLNYINPTFMAAFLYLGAGIGVGIMYIFHYRKEEKTPETLDFTGFSGGVFGVPEVIRTPDLPLRRRSLYPTELRAHTVPVYDTRSADVCQPPAAHRPEDRPRRRTPAGTWPGSCKGAYALENTCDRRRLRRGRPKTHQNPPERPAPGNGGRSGHRQRRERQ